MFMSTLIPASVSFIKMLLCYMLAYIISATIAGAFSAWVAKKCGDLTADYAGFLTLDPLAHIDPVGMIALIIFKFGWGREIPINIYAIKPPMRDLKILLTYYSAPLMHIFFISSSIIAIAFLDTYASGLPLNPTLMLFVQSWITLNSGLCLLRFIQASVDLIFIPLKLEDEQNVRIISLIAAFIILFFLGNQIQYFFIKLSLIISQGILKLLS